MERGEADTSWGTVYYAISLFVLSLLAYLFKERIILYSGILIMAYGDGLAALIGEKYGKKDQFLGIKGKSFAGSLTVAIAALIVSFACIKVFTDLSIPAILFISIMAALFSSLVELVSLNGIDNITLPISSSIFIAVSIHAASTGYFVYLVAIALILGFAFAKDKLTLNGVATAFMTGALIYGFGGLWLGLALIAFFVLGTVITKFKSKDKEEAKEEKASNPRNWTQVIANSLPAVILAFIYHLTGNKDILMIAFAVFAAASSDTFASELGTKTNSTVRSLATLKEVPKGLSGGVTIPGFVFSLIGSFLLALLSVPQFGTRGLLINTILGFLGAIIDSLLGATLQKKYLNEEGHLQDDPEYKGQEIAKGLEYVSNSMVNLITLSVVAVLGFLWI